MRRLLLPLGPLALLLALAGCSGDDAGDDGADGGGARGGSGSGATTEELAAACDALGEEQVTGLTGVPVTREDQDLPGGVTCTYYDRTTDTTGIGVLTVVVVADDGSFDDLQDLAGTSAGDVETEPLELAGAEEAIVVDDTASGVPTTSVLARTTDRAFTVYPSGLTRDDEVRIGTGALSVLLGDDPGEPVADRTEVPHPCDQLTGQEAGGALGVGVTATRSKPGATPICVYETADGDYPLSLVDLGRGQRVEDAGAPVDAGPSERVEAPEPLVAYAPAAEATGTTMVVATDRTVLSIEVEGPGGRRLAESLLPALVP